MCVYESKKRLCFHRWPFTFKNSMSQPPPENPYESPIEAEQVYQQPAINEGDATGGLIPYKNPKALIAYYMGVASLLIFPLGFASIILGFMGLADRKRNPAIKGAAHAWIGIVLGAISILCGGAFVSLIVFGIATGR